ERFNHRLIQQNRELFGLHRAGLAVVAELSLESVLQQVVDQARSLIGARFGALSVVTSDHRILAFVTSGISDEESKRIGAPPKGRGLLGVVLNEGQRLSIDDLAKDPRSVGFPENHPPMHSLLAVPVICERTPYRGNLYLSEKLDGKAFDQENEDTLVRFATQAAIAIDNAHLYRRVAELAAAEERLRIAHEMHDGLAQLLAYVNTKVQAVREYLRNDRAEEAGEQLEQLSVVSRQVYSDVRSQILDLRSSARTGRGELADTLQQYIVQWQQQSGIEASLRLPDELQDLDPEIELQLLRIIQEALANVRKHASASQVDLELERQGQRIQAVITDDGKGFDPHRLSPGSGPRFGLSTMRERAASVGGSLTISSDRDSGTVVVVDLPNIRPQPEVPRATHHR
ncbi:MAG: GAF domain-containing sensor histidine kinase, partial [Acidobacteria bacterium]|nr:GAF domain-containing sensor histidine kinase [Acidobacteriota bacterium]